MKTPRLLNIEREKTGGANETVSRITVRDYPTSGAEVAIKLTVKRQCTLFLSSPHPDSPFSPRLLRKNGPNF